MSPRTTADPGLIINEIESLIDQAVGLGTTLDNIPEKTEGSGPEDNSVHRKRAKLALVLIDIRDRSEKLIAAYGEGEAPGDFNLLLARLTGALAYLDKADDCRAFYDAIVRILPAERSAWHIAESSTTVVNAYLSQDRHQEAIDFYRSTLYLNQYEEATICLARSAFYLVSRLVMDEKLSMAQEVYDTMDRYGGGSLSLTLVDAEDGDEPLLTLEPPAESASRPEGGNPKIPFLRQAPVFTLVDKPASASPDSGAAGEGAGPDYIGTVRAQAAVNLISGYALTGQVEKAQEVYRAMPNPEDVEEYVMLRSMASVNLVCAFIRNRRWDRAMGVLDELRELGRLSDNAIYQAKAVVEIIGYTEEDKLPEAKRLYESLEGLAGSWDFNIERMRAAGNLVYAAGEYGHFDLARRVYDTLSSFGSSHEALLVRTAATLNLMSDYCSSSMLAEAEELFKILESFDNLPEVAESKAQGAFNLMSFHIRRGRIQMAEELYERIKSFGDGPQVVRMLAHATFGLVTEYLKIDNFEGALKAYSRFGQFDRTIIFMLEQVKALYNLVQYCCDKGLRTLAQGYYKDFYDIYLSGLKNTDLDEGKAQMESYFELNGNFFGFVFHDFDSPREDSETELFEYLSDAGTLIVSHFAQNMRYKEAQEVFGTLLDLTRARCVKPVVSNALQASFEMIIYLMGDGYVAQAMDIFEGYDDFPKSPELGDMVDEQRIQSGLHIIENTRSLPKIKLLFERLSEYAGRAKYIHYLAQAALRYGELLCESGDFAEARRVYELLSTFGETKRVHMCRLQLAILLLERYLAAGDRDNAETLYATFKKIGRSKQVLKLRDQAARLVDKIFKLNNVILKMEQPEPQEARVDETGPGPRPDGRGRGRGSEDV
jgi:tetratricopeptide (TPR) repeat protein